MANSSVNIHRDPSSPSLAVSQHSVTDSHLHPHPHPDTRTHVDIDDSRPHSELLSSHPPPALTVTSSELETHSYTRNTSSDIESQPRLDNSQSNRASTRELSGVAVSSSIINDGHSASDSQGDLYIKVPAYNAVVGRTPPPSYSSLVPYGPSPSQPVASSSRTTTPPHHPPPSTLVIPEYARSPVSSSSYGTIPPASANPFSNTVPTSYTYTYSPSPVAFGPTPMNASHPLLAAPHAEEYIEAPGAADRRARWRFAGAVCWGFGVWMGLAGLMALEVWGEGGK